MLAGILHIDVDRRFHGVPICRAFLPPSGVCVSDYPAIILIHQPRILCCDVLDPRKNFLRAEGVLLKRDQRVQNVVVVDLGNARGVYILHGPDPFAAKDLLSGDHSLGSTLSGGLLDLSGTTGMLSSLSS